MSRRDAARVWMPLTLRAACCAPPTRGTGASARSRTTRKIKIGCVDTLRWSVTVPSADSRLRGVTLSLPPDDHTHSEWSWDAIHGSMERSCARAIELGVPSIAFTEHVDLARWHIAPESQAAMRRGEH